MESKSKNRKLAKLPMVRMAVFCENAIQDKEDLWSVIRVLDKITVRIESDQSSNQNGIGSGNFPPLLLRTNLLVMLQDFSDVEPVEVVITAESDIGQDRETLAEFLVTPTGERLGMNLKFELNLAVSESSRRWIEVRIQNRRIVRLPLEIEVLVPEFDSNQ